MRYRARLTRCHATRVSRIPAIDDEPHADAGALQCHAGRPPLVANSHVAAVIDLPAALPETLEPLLLRIESFRRRLRRIGYAENPIAQTVQRRARTPSPPARPAG